MTLIVKGHVATILIQRYFTSGWTFFLPYLFGYIFAMVVGLPVSVLKLLFILIHFLHLILLIPLLIQKYSEMWSLQTLFWVGLFMLLLLPGVYLEYPSDPWEHFRRIFSWSSFPTVSESPLRYRFSYFWGWTTLSWVPISGRRMALTFYSAFWQFLLCYQFYRLMITLGFNTSWARVQVIAFLTLFGTNLFSFRYYSLSSTTLAYICYLQVLTLIISRSFKDLKYFFTLALLLFTILFNHTQEAFFAVLSAATLFAVFLTMNSSLAIRAKVVLGIGVTLFSFYPIGAWLFQQYPGLYEQMTIEKVSRLGIFEIWRSGSRYLETVGVHGLIGLLSSLFLLKKYPIISALSLYPTFTLLFPPTVLVIAKLFPADAPYRILYAFPTSVALVTAVRELFSSSFLRSRIKDDWRRACGGLIPVVALALPYKFPWRGRLFFQFHSPPKELSFKSLDETANWFQKNRKYPLNCAILTEDATGFVLSAHLGRPLEIVAKGTVYKIIDRLLPIRYFDRLESRPRYYVVLTTFEPCGILVADPKQIPQSPPSTIVKYSNHWNPLISDLRWHQNENQRAYAESLNEKVWKKTPVPPFYTLYEPR